MAKLEMMAEADRIVMLARAERIRRHRTATLCIGFAILALVTLAMPWAEAAVDAWVDMEEAKAAQAYRRTP
jgi:hypothetical protein